MAIPENNEMRFEVTTRCNYNCLICPRAKMTRAMETMSFELFRKLFDKIMDETYQYNTLTFSGIGEPLLDEELNQKIAYIKKQKQDLSILVLTNASLLTLNRFKELEALGVNSIRVSFYGNDSKSYAEMHGLKNKKLFSNVRDNLIKISQIKGKTKLLLTLNIYGENGQDYAAEWIKFWGPKVDLMEVWRPHNWVDCKQYRIVQNEKLKTCGRPFNGPLQVQADGTVIMCCFDFNGKIMLGDLKTQSLAQIFSSLPYNHLADCHKAGNFKNSGLICQNCDQRNKDKTQVMIYNSKFDIKERVNQFSTTYHKVSY